MTTAYSYLRFSSAQQVHSDSVHRQLEASNKYAEQHGLTLDTQFHLRDLGISAFRGADMKGQLDAFIKAIDDKLIQPSSYLLVESIDRLSRAPISESLHLFTSILSKGIYIVTISDGKLYTPDSINNLTDLFPCCNEQGT